MQVNVNFLYSYYKIASKKAYFDEKYSFSATVLSNWDINTFFQVKIVHLIRYDKYKYQNA